MPSVTKRNDHESVDAMIRRFKKLVDRADTIKDARKHEFYEKPAAERKRAKAAAGKREEKRRREDRLPSKTPSFKKKKEKRSFRSQ